MSNRSGILMGAAIAAVVVLAATGSAFAQAAGGGGGGGGAGTGGGSSGDPTAVLKYGQSGNCPPGVNCGHPYDPPVVKRQGVDLYDPCGDYDKRSVKYRECRRQF